MTAFVGNTEWAAFDVDLVGQDLRMTGAPEDVPPLARVAMPDVEQHGYRAYPLVDHVADKACAIFERHGAIGTPSTRYRDLVDLVAIVLAASVEAEPQMTALRSEAQRRGLQLPGRFAVPDRGLWPGRAGGGDGKQRLGAHGQHGVPVQGGSGPDLVLVQACLPLALLVAFLHRPSLPGDPDQYRRGRRLAGGCVAVEPELVTFSL